MPSDFTFSFVGIQSPEAAFEAWRFEDFATLESIPALLDQGLSTSDEVFWSAPPAFLGAVPYRGLRLGFRERTDSRWEWLYLVRGITGG
jgi:hypothetical protein